MSDERKCTRCGMLQRMKDEEICEPCMELLILGIGNSRNEDAWNRFVEELSDVLIRADRKGADPMSEHLSKEAVLNRAKSRIEWFRNRSEEWQKQGVASKQKEMYEAYIALEEFVSEIQSGAFDADNTEVQRLRAALVEIKQLLNENRENDGAFKSWNHLQAWKVATQALSTTTEPINAEKVERVREGDENA